jgi:hypothetical protein
MSTKRTFTLEETLDLGRRLGVDWTEIHRDEFRRGLAVELEHGAHDPQTNVTSDDPVITAKIALAHLKEIPDYYSRLARMEADAKAEKQPREKLHVRPRR